MILLSITSPCIVLLGLLVPAILQITNLILILTDLWTHHLTINSFNLYNILIWSIQLRRLFYCLRYLSYILFYRGIFLSVSNYNVLFKLFWIFLRWTYIVIWHSLLLNLLINLWRLLLVNSFSVLSVMNLSRTHYYIISSIILWSYRQF